MVEEIVQLFLKQLRYDASKNRKHKIKEIIIQYQESHVHDNILDLYNYTKGLHNQVVQIL